MDEAEGGGERFDDVVVEEVHDAPEQVGRRLYGEFAVWNEELVRLGLGDMARDGRDAEVRVLRVEAEGRGDEEERHEGEDMAVGEGVAVVVLVVPSRGRRERRRPQS